MTLNYVTVAVVVLFGFSSSVHASWTKSHCHRVSKTAFRLCWPNFSFAESHLAI
jgi:hypothetical protein